MVVPYVLVVTEPYPGIAVSARPFSSCGQNGRNIGSIVTCATAVFPLTPPMPVVFFEPRTREREL